MIRRIEFGVLEAGEFVTGGSLHEADHSGGRLRCQNFAIWCEDNIKTLIETGSVSLPTQPKVVKATETAVKIESLQSPMMKSVLSQMFAEEYGSQLVLAPSERPAFIPIAVLARDMGYSCQAPIDSMLGKYAKKHLAPADVEHHGKYPINVYARNNEAENVVANFFSQS